MQSLRGVTLPDDEVLDLLRDSFTVAWRNIHKDEHVGLSSGYRCSQTALGTTNGAGGRNVQLVVLAPDETVLHVLPGFWHPEDLARELRFARTLCELWCDAGKTREQKQRIKARMHAAHVRELPAAAIARSGWQGFDRRAELDRADAGTRDTFVRSPGGAILHDRHGPRLKPIVTLVHDRMLARPFVPLAAFDMAVFVDYGRPYYDNNAGLDDGVRFPAAERANKKRELEQKRAQQRAGQPQPGQPRPGQPKAGQPAPAQMGP